MKTFDVYQHPVNGFQTVKVGFGWPAFFFATLWAFVKRMWGYGFAFLGVNMLLMLLQDVFIQARNDGGVFLSLGLQLVVAIVIGMNANDWRREHLARRGYKKVRTVSAPTAEAAIAVAGTPGDDGMEQAVRLAG